MMEHRGGASPLDHEAAIRERFLRHLNQDNFVLFFQPIVPVVSSDDEPDFREIFVRYKEEEEGLLPPGSFLPILEDQGLLPFLDRWVVFRLLRWSRDNSARAPAAPRLRCSINLSLDTVRRDKGFGAYVLGDLEKTGVRADSLSFEIPAADALVYRASLSRMIPAMRELGCTFALSGFAGDEPAFEIAASLGITFVKLDSAFAAARPRDAAIATGLGAIIERCRDVGLRTIATHVEDSETWARLRMLKVDYVQGFGIDRPRPLT